MRASALPLLLVAFPGVLTAQLTCGDATVDARSLRYCTGGTGSDVVVFESRIGAGAAAWDASATQVASFARVVTWDRAGTGGSPAAAGERAPTQVAADLRLLLNRLGHRSPVVLVAHRDGAWFARAYARLFPDRVRALVLVDPPHEDFEPRVRALLTPAEQAARDSSIAATVAALPEAARREIAAVRTSPPGDLPEVPLVVIGAGSHDWIPRERSQTLEALWHELETALAGRVSGGQTRFVAAAGPDLLQTHPAVIADAVRDVLARSNPGGLNVSRDVVMWSIGLAVTVAFGLLAWRQGRSGARFNQIQIAKAEAERARIEAIVPDPHEIGLFDLVPRDTPPAGLSTALLGALNARAAMVFEHQLRGGRRDAQAEQIWGKTWDTRDWNAQQAWVEPYDNGSGGATTLAQDVLTMLRRGERRIWVTGPAGAGKSTLMNRLFFEAIGVADGAGSGGTPASPSLPVPMFVQPRNVGAQGIQQLREASLTLPVFLQGWLANRMITVPAESRDALVSDFGRALEAGDIVLVLDGYDELVDLGLERFLRDLLSHATAWVCAERSDRRLSRTGVSVSLLPTWDLAQIRRHLEVRWPNRPAWTPRVFEHLKQATGDDHILLVPRYLDLFLRLLEEAQRLPEEAELRELSRGGPELCARIVALALDRLPVAPGIDEHELNARLSRVAKDRVLQADFVLDRKDRDPTWERILQMTEFVAHVPTTEGDNIRITHPALVDYFLAGQIANELRIGAPVITQGDRHWSRGLLAGVSLWLRRSPDPGIVAAVWQRIESAPADAPVANLLELSIALASDRQHDPRHHRSERERRRDVTVSDRDLGGKHLEGAELHLVSFVRCRFTGTNLREADFEHATLQDCELVGADLAGANAVGAEFARCRFRDPANPALLPDVDGFLIEGAEFHEGAAAASDADAAWLAARGALTKRTRYGNEFGRIFFNRQSAFLGDVAETLERGPYRVRIEAALTRCPPNRPITVVDLMAGGGNEWLAGLVTVSEDGRPRFPGLRVLGIDRDEPQLRELKRRFPDVFKWHRHEIGSDGIDLPAIVGEVFDPKGERLDADVIVARKALHELRRPLQPRLIAACFAGLRPDGEFVLYADSPGPLEPSEGAMPDSRFRAIDGEIRGLLLDPRTPLDRIRERIVTGLSFDGTEADQAAFCNLWVLVKDWANGNLHEVRNRWFSSAGEIRTWARAAGFTESSPPTAARYRIVVARFNERGIQRALHHVMRNGPEVVTTDAAMLTDWLSGEGDDRLTMLLEFSAHHLAAGGPLADALSAKPEHWDLGKIDRTLSRLSRGRQSATFEFPVHVLSFRK
jgi:pimeloyl-ACP methyl ester carboxylesterase